MKPTNELYFQYAHTIDAVVGKYARQYPDLADDLYLQAGLVFCHACESYDPNHPSGAGFGTWLSRCLQSLTELVDKAIHGPNTCIHGGPAPVRSFILEGQEEDLCDPSAGAFSAAIASGFVDEYSGNLGVNDEYPPELRPYLDALKGDALRVFHDFANGVFAIKPDPSKNRAYNRAKEYLNPKKIYMRHYIKLGWSMARTRKAFEGLKNMLELYRQDKLPCTLSHLTA